AVHLHSRAQTTSHHLITPPVHAPHPPHSPSTAAQPTIITSPSPATTRLRNEITNFHQRPVESLFEAWECYKLSIHRCPNHNMLPVTQINTFYNGLTLRTINAAAGGTFMKRRPEECYDLIKNITTHHNDWDTSAQRSESSSSITSSFDTKIVSLKAEMVKINKNLMRILLVNQQVKAVTPSCETYGGSHSYNDCPATIGQTQNVYAAGAYQGSGTLPGNTIINPKEELKGITTRSGTAYCFKTKNSSVNFSFFISILSMRTRSQSRSRNNSPQREAIPAIVEPMRIEFPFLEDQSQEYPPPESTSSSTPAISADVDELKYMVKALLLDKKNQSPAPTLSTTPAQVNQASVYQAPIPQTQKVSQLDFESYVKANDAILRNMQSQGQSTQSECQNIQNQNQNLQNQMATLTEMMSKLISANTASSSGSGTLPVAPVSAPMPNLKPSIPYPSRRKNEKCRDQANEQIKKFYEIFKEMSFEISFTDALILMPKFASTLKALIGNKEKLSEMARTTMNEHCLAVILNKLPRKLGDRGKFLIPCEFSGMDECLALAELGASINLMPFSVWKALSLPELTPTCMTLELADRSVSKPIGIAKDVSFKVGVFHFPADFVVVDFEPDPRVPLIIGRCFLKTSRALIDVHKGELTLRIGIEAITYNLDQTVRYSANYNQMTANRIDFVCEEYSQETASPGTFKFPLTLVIKKRQHSPTHMALLPTAACLSACAMLWALFKG
nr:reverse transcriptase domain-containing protein [Tanacetum cinerariifolium]